MEIWRSCGSDIDGDGHSLLDDTALKGGRQHVSDSDFHIRIVGRALTLDRPGRGKFSSSLGITS